jgi:polyribonucleotide nucleotidyltransferase
MEPIKASMELAGREFTVTNGPISSYASGYAIVSLGDTVIMANATMSKEGKEGASWFPMFVDYQENFFASGKIKGSRFVKRMGRPSEKSTLVSRLIDRPIRPLFPKGTTNEVQIICTTLSADMEVDPATTAINAASIALMISGAPFDGPIGSVRMGYIDGKLIVNPTYKECEEGTMNLVVAGTADAITMVEAALNEVDEEIILDALEMAHAEIKTICQFQLDYAKNFNPTPIVAATAEANADAQEAVSSFVSEAMLNNIKGETKMVVKERVHEIEEQLFEKYATEIEEEKFSKRDLAEELNGKMEKHMRKNILENEIRIDGRKLTDVRAISVFPDVLPRTHGSALFQRGETMALSVATLGGPGDAQILDTMEDNDKELRYFHHYSFPPFSVGDVRPMRGPGRREIGHGDLAERALLPVLPSAAEFPYTIWVHSEITRCNGSSSMASVCGSTLSLMCTGVPIKRPVVGIAMGLVSDKESGSYKILSDIQGLEDFAGDMDFKVTGSTEGITALQMDMKVKGLSIDLLREALAQAKEGRSFIMGEMLKVVPEVRKELSSRAPLIMSMQIDPEMIGKVIGKGGETIQKITKECEVEIDITDDGIINITAPSQDGGEKAKDWIEKLTYQPKVGDIIEGPVLKILEFGAIVQLGPGTDGLVHISELANERVARVEDVVKEGDNIKVKVVNVDKEKGRIGLSLKQAQAEQGGGAGSSAPANSAPAAKQPEQGKGGHGEVVEGTTSVRKVNGAK